MTGSVVVEVACSATSNMDLARNEDMLPGVIAAIRISTITSTDLIVVDSRHP
jgi:hypothetical protein